MMRLQPIVARGASLNFCLIVTLDWRHGGSPMGFGLQKIPYNRHILVPSAGSHQAYNDHFKLGLPRYSFSAAPKLKNHVCSS